MARRKAALIAQPTAVRQEAAAAAPAQPANFQEFKQAAEQHYAPEPEKAPTERVVFVGTGSYLPTIGGKSYRIVFRPQTQYQVVVTDPALVEWMRGRGFKELDR